jgi:uncharacterized protein
MTYTTPGVFIEEISTFPPSVVPVETAVPVFIGYCERASGADGASLIRVPTRVRSLLEYEAMFGGAFLPVTYRVQLDAAAGNALGTVTPRDATNAARRYFLHLSLRQHFANGGGPCIVVAVGLYPALPAIGTTTTELRGGIEAVRSLDAPTLLLFPDAVNLAAADLGALQVAALQQCAALQDRFAILDLASANAPPGIGVDPADTFRQNVGTENLRYGAAYYPWLRTIYRPEVHFRDIEFVTPANMAIPNATIDGLIPDAAMTALVTAVRNADAQVGTVVSAVNVGAWVAAPVTLSRRNFRDMEAHYATLTQSLRALPLPVTLAALRPVFGNLVLLPRALALALPAIQAAVLAPEIAQSITSLSTDTNVQDAVIALIALEKHANVMPLIAAGRTVANVATAYAVLDGTTWIGANANAGAIAPNATALAGATDIETALNAAAAIAPHLSRLAAAVVAVFDAAEFIAAGAETRLFDGHPVMRAGREAVVREMSLIPPSGAVAGIYSAVDRSRGVWTAPANVSLADLIGPVVKVNDAGQSRLNVHSTGKSVNAIRAFAGKGTLIWGGRTLDGNSNEWRYINVRRFFNMAEKSIKKATEPFTFEPNVANTWVRVKSMIESFLTVQWRQGALRGATTAQAFSVKIGLGETMTAQDILEGNMIVEVGMAVVRPAEFIVLKFSHKMQVS